MLLTYSVTLAVWQSCSLACRHVIEERKCLGATPFQDFPTWSQRCRHVITLLLGKMSWFLYDFRVILVSQTLASQRDRSSELLCVALSFKLFFSLPNQISTRVPDMKVLWRIQKLRCAALWWMRSWIISLSVYKVTNLHTLIRIPVRLFLRSYRNKREENHRQIPGTLITAGTLIRLRRVLYVRNLSRNHTALQYTSMS